MHDYMHKRTLKKHARYGWVRSGRARTFDRLVVLAGPTAMQLVRDPLTLVANLVPPTPFRIATYNVRRLGLAKILRS